MVGGHAHGLQAARESKEVAIRQGDASAVGFDAHGILPERDVQILPRDDAHGGYLSESSLWYRKRPGKRTKAAPVLVQETEADTAAAAKAAALLRSEYGRGAIAAYVQGWLGESDVCRSEDIPLKNDKDYVMSLLAVLTGGDRSADFTVQELDGERRENGYAIPELQISRKENNE